MEQGSSERPPARAPRSGALLETATRALAERFGRGAEWAARAPGRVNLIGEHTDYNQGLAMPCAIDRETWVVGAARDDGLLRVASLEIEAAREGIEIRLDRLAARGHWSDYVAAPAWALRESGVPTPGMDLIVTSTVPIGSGLSSSAALGVATTGVLAAAAGASLSPRAIAECAWRGECDFIGVGCGILDPYAVALSEADHALRIDCQDRSVEATPLGGDAIWLVAQSGVPRSVAQGRYQERVAECAAALRDAKRGGLVAETAASLRALDGTPPDRLASVMSGVSLRRARHVITENARVDAFAAAFRDGDLPAAGEVLKEGMRSLREDYDASVPELDALCALGDGHPACHGSRLTGAGWGGCTLHLVDPDAADAVADALEAGFRREFGRSPEVVRLKSAAPASVIRV